MRPVRMTARLVCLLSLALSTLAGCGGDDTPPMPDAPPRTDAPPVGDIQMARNAADGATSVPIAGAFVTYLKPAVGTDPAGFFIQKVQAGPALFVAVDPATLAPAPAVGDTVSFTVTAMGTAGMLRQATAVSGWTRDASGGSVAALIRDLWAAADLATNVGAYESELVRLVGTVAGPFGFGGTGHQSAQLATAGITGDTNFNFRVPDGLRDTLDLAQTCAITINGTPLWRYNAQTQPSAWVAADVTVTSCPAPRVTAATAASATSVLVTFDRRIDPAS